jgi:hypothetical protein
MLRVEALAVHRCKKSGRRACRRVAGILCRAAVHNSLRVERTRRVLCFFFFFLVTMILTCSGGRIPARQKKLRYRTVTTPCLPLRAAGSVPQSPPSLLARFVPYTWCAPHPWRLGCGARCPSQRWGRRRRAVVLMLCRTHVLLVADAIPPPRTRHNAARRQFSEPRARIARAALRPAATHTCHTRHARHHAHTDRHTHLHLWFAVGSAPADVAPSSMESCRARTPSSVSCCRVLCCSCCTHTSSCCRRHPPPPPHQAIPRHVTSNQRASRTVKATASSEAGAQTHTCH